MSKTVHDLTTFYRVAYQQLDTGMTNEFGSQVNHFYNDVDLFEEFFKVVVEKNSCALDIGAHYGTHTDLFLKCGFSHVYSIEASPVFYEKLLFKYAENVNVTLFHYAVSDVEGSFDFYDTGDGASSLKITDGNKDLRRNKIIVPGLTLDSMLKGDLLKFKVACIKLDIEGAEIPSLVGARNLIDKHRPYIIMEYAHNCLSFEWNHETINKYTLTSFCDSINYIPYNIYGVALTVAEVYDASIFGDTYDVILVPSEKIVKWSTAKLPIYQYKILDKICSRIENYEPFPGYHSLTSLPKRIYDIVNEKNEAASINFLTHVHKQLHRLPISLDTIDELNTLWKRGKLLLKLIYLNKINDAYDLSIIKHVDDSVFIKYLQHIRE